MDDVRLIPIVHPEQATSGFIDLEMGKFLESQVLPHLNNKSVIVMEGGRKYGKVEPGEPAYSWLFSQLRPLCFSDVRPTIHSDDPMYNHDDQSLHKIWELAVRYSQVVHECARLVRSPSTWEELILSLRSGSPSVQIVAPIPALWAEFAKYYANFNIARDAGFAAQIRRYAKSGRQVFFIGGTVHCVMLAAKYKQWRFIPHESSLEELQTTAMACWHGYGGQ